MTATLKGQFRIRGLRPLSDAARVETDVFCVTVPAEVYKARGIAPAFEDLPWDDGVAGSGSGASDVHDGGLRTAQFFEFSSSEVDKR